MAANPPVRSASSAFVGEVRDEDSCIELIWKIYHVVVRFAVVVVRIAAAARKFAEKIAGIVVVVAAAAAFEVVVAAACAADTDSARSKQEDRRVFAEVVDEAAAAADIAGVGIEAAAIAPEAEPVLVPSVEAARRSPLVGHISEQATQPSVDLSLAGSKRPTDCWIVLLERRPAAEALALPMGCSV